MAKKKLKRRKPKPKPEPVVRDTPDKYANMVPAQIMASMLATFDAQQSGEFFSAVRAEFGDIAKLGDNVPAKNWLIALGEMNHEERLAIIRASIAKPAVAKS